MKTAVKKPKGPRQNRSRSSPTSRLVGMKQAAAELGLSYGLWRSIVLRGEIPHVKIGRCLFLERTDIAAFVAAHKETAA